MNQQQLTQPHEQPLPTSADAIVNMEIGRTQLFTDVHAAIAQGVLPDSQAAQALASRWLQLAEEGGETHAATLSDMAAPIKQWMTAAIAYARLALFAQYLTTIELAELKRRQLAHADDWQILFAEVRHQMQSGAKVTDPAMRMLAQRWQSLFRDSYCGDNLELENKIRAAIQSESKLMQTIGLDLSLLGFIQSAILLLNGPRHQSDNTGPKPSAQRVATLRAAHQLLDSPIILQDPLALKILGNEDEAALRANPSQYNDPMSKGLRSSLVVRSRLAEDEYEKAAERGVRQYVILGAGLDTYAYRTKLRDAHYVGRIFEVDLPETQQWKRACLRAADIQIPDTVTYVPINFEQDTLSHALSMAGFQQDQPAFFSWLGVTMYLEEEAIMDTLRYITSCAKGSAVVFDYLVEPLLLTPMERVVINLIATRVADHGEPWKTYFEPDVLAEKLRTLGFSSPHNLSRDDLTQRYLSNRLDGLSLGNSSRLMHAIV